MPAERNPERLKRCRTVQAADWGELGGGGRCSFWGESPGLITEDRGAHELRAKRVNSIMCLMGEGENVPVDVTKLVCIVFKCDI